MTVFYFLQKADVAAFGIITTYDKFLVLDISVPLIIEPHRIIVPWPKEESRLLATIRPFQPLVFLKSMI